MGKRGPKPKPTALKRAQGNPGKRALPDNEPMPSPAVDLTPPDWLDRDVRKEWRRVVPELDRLGIYTTLDRSVLIGYCMAYSDYKLARQKIREVGHVMDYRDEHGNVKGSQVSSYWTVAKQALDQMRKCGAEFGIGPSSRAGLAIPGPEPVDELEELLSGRRGGISCAEIDAILAE